MISPQKFAQRLQALQADGWRTITAATLAAHIATGESLPPKTMVITIDDGRVDGYTYAFPILQRLGFVATYYVITSRIGRTHYLSVAQLQEMDHAGMEIGNHSLHHQGIHGRTDAYYLDEVNVAQAQLTSWLGSAPVTFAYPFGLHPNGLVQAVKSAGLRLAFTTTAGHFEDFGTRFLTPRMRLGASLSPSQVVWKMDHLR